MTSTAPKRWRPTLMVALGCGLFVYLVIRLGVRQVARSLLEIGWHFALIAAIYVGYELVRSFAYWGCVTATGRFPYWDLFRFRLSGEAIQFLTSTGPFLAEPAKMWLLRERGLSTKRAVAATVCEYLIYTLTSATLAVIGVVYLLGHVQVSRTVAVAARVAGLATAAFLATAVCAILGRIYLIGAILKWVRTLPAIGRHMRFPERDVRDTEDLLFIVLRDRPRRLLSILAVEFAAQTLLVLELFVLLRAAGVAFSAFQPFLIEGATKYIGLAFFFIPGQVGAAEGTYALIFSAIGLPASAGFSLAVARRLRSLLVAGLGLALAAVRTPDV